ncbi:MAG: PDZ domain-containing protein [Actinobacteria bacterium]|nr:PDZ domain-containing protein [Actinomycetota bacterium]
MTDPSNETSGNGLPYQGQQKTPRTPGRPEGAGTSVAKLLIPFLAPLIFMLVAVPTGFLLESPGPSFDLQEGLEVEGAETYPSRGELLLTSVSLQESRLINNIASLFDDSFELLKVRDYLGEELNTEEQDTVDIVITFLSQDTAVVAGLQEVGEAVEVEELGMFVVDVGSGYPASGVLNAGEVIVAVDDVPVTDGDDFSEMIDSTPEGESVELQVKEIDAELAEEFDEEVAEGAMQRPDLSELLVDGVREVEIQPVYEPELGRKIIGISVRDFFAYTSEVEVEWDLETVKGPSAGMMMTLSLVNALTPDDLTAGEKIAGTGEISIDGEVGPIGGLPFKIRAAESEGATLFIYPVGNQEDLEGFSTSLELGPVDTLEEAIEVLRGLQVRAAESEGAIYPVGNQEDLEGLSTSLELGPVDTLEGAIEVLRGL